MTETVAGHSTSPGEASAGASSFASARRWRNEIVVGLAIAAAYGLVWPVGDYAVMDDWAYVRSLQVLHDDGQVRILDWNPMSLVGHLFWGLLFTKMLGFSFTVTKLSVVAIHLVECFVLLRLLALYGVSANLALAAVLALAFNPLHFVHAFTYMTDVPALAWQILAIYCYSKGLLAIEQRPDDSTGKSQGNPERWLAAGSVVAGWTFLTRQNGVLVPAALALYLALFARRQVNWRTALAAFGPATLLMAGFTWWYQTVHGPTHAYVNSMRRVKEFALHPPLAELPLIVFSLLVYVGWFLIPLAVAVPLRAYRLPHGWRRTAFLGLAAVLVNALAWYAWKDGKIFPYVWNVITPFGLYSSGEFMIGLRDVLWGKKIGVLIGSVSLFSGLVFVLRILLCRPGPRSADRRVAGASTGPAAAQPFDDSSDRAQTVGMRFLLLLLGFQLAYSFATTPILYDRHLLLLSPTVVALFCLACRGLAPLSAWRYVACLAPLAFYALTTTHDLNALSRVAFEAANDLIAEGVDPREVVAGYAFDCWSTYDERSNTEGEYEPTAKWWRKPFWTDWFFDGVQPTVDRPFRWPPRAWWVGSLSSGARKHYAVTCSVPVSMPGSQPFEVYRRHPYRTWWPWRESAVYVIRDRNLREDDAEP